MIQNDQMSRQIRKRSSRMADGKSGMISRLKYLEPTWNNQNQTRRREGMPRGDIQV